MEKPLISFIIPYYDLPVQMLCECIESVLALSLRNVEREIIIIDDGSSKSPVETLTRYEQDIIYIRQPHRAPTCSFSTATTCWYGRPMSTVST